MDPRWIIAAVFILFIAYFIFYEKFKKGKLLWKLICCLVVCVFLIDLWFITSLLFCRFILRYALGPSH